MPRTKNKKAVEEARLPQRKPSFRQNSEIDVNINKAEWNFASAHVLNLRDQEKTKDKHPAGQLTFEEKAEVLDKRVREMPDFLKTRISNLSHLWNDESTELFAKSARWGKTIQKRFEKTAKKTKKQLVKKPHWYARFSAQVCQFAFIAILIILITIPLQAFLLYKSINGFYTDLKSNINNASANLNTLKNAARTGQVQPISSALNALLPEISKIRVTLDHLGPLKIILPNKFKLASDGVYIAEQGIISLTNLVASISDLQTGQGKSGALIRTISTELKTLNAYTSELLGKKAQSDLLKPLLAKLDIATGVSSVIADLYGSQDTRHLLLIFQNPRELRATGGFAGSFALITTRDGEIISITAPEGGTYAIQGQMPLNYISPQPLQLINPRFEFQDANWWPDFPRSAKKITELFETAGGPTIDGVIAITAKVGEEMLKINGPIQTAEGLVNADNFIDTLQSAIARDRSQDRKTPKKVITALLPMMKSAFINTAQEHPKELLTALVNLSQSKDIQIWARSNNNQKILSRLGLTGELKNTSGDYLAVITSNVGGGKTDGVIEENITHNVRIQANQVARETLKIQREHKGYSNNSFEMYRNVSFIRIYVPKQAQFVSATGNTPPPEYIFEKPNAELSPDPEIRAEELTLITDARSKTRIWQENNKTVFGVWMITDPGETTEITVQYDVPLADNGQIIPYSITVDPQGGKLANFNEQITLDDSIKTLTGNQAGSWTANSWKYNGTLNKTLVTSGIFYKL